jgi:16S rRNA (uracil1498-N3)-methyltransferase
MAHIFRFLGRKSHDLDLESTRFWQVDPDEIEHAKKVLKVKSGDVVEVMDGSGLVATGEVREISRDKMIVAASLEVFVEEPKVKSAIAIGALKPGDFDEIMPALIELGTLSIHVFQQADTAKFRTSDKAQTRWDRIALASVKQCKSAWLPKVHVHAQLEDLFQALKVYEARFVMDLAGSKTLLDGVNSTMKSVAVIVGGERGLTPAELAMCSAQGFTCVRLGQSILRAKTAAIATAAVLSAVLS